MKGFLRLFSYLFYPLFIPVYATLLYFLVAGSFMTNIEAFLLFVQVLIITVLLPISVFYLLRSLGHVQTKMLTEKKERRMPLAIYSLLLLMLTQYSFAELGVKELYYFFTGLLISNVIALGLVMVNMKASLHMLAITAFTTFIISLSVYYHIRFIYLIAFFILCCGFVASSRLEARAHTTNELILGTLVGVVPQIGLWYIWLLPTF